jgi:maleate isomerase
MRDEYTKEGMTTRIGVIAPSDGINDDEYNNYLPAQGGVTLLWTRYETAAHDEPISVDMVGSYGDLDQIAQVARMMRITRPHVSIFCCNSCSFSHGPAGDQNIRDTIAEATGGHATSVTNAEVEALRTLGVKRVAVAAPYRAEVTAKLIEYLEQSGFQVTQSRSKALISEWQIGNSPSSVWLDLAKQADSPETEAVVLACSGIRTSDIMEKFEAEQRKPLIAAPAVVMWHALRLAGIATQSHGRGILFAEY